MISKKVPVKIDPVIKNKVAKKVAGTNTTIGEFFEEAAKEKLKPIKK